MNVRFAAAMLAVSACLTGCNAGSPPPPDANKSYPEQLQAARTELDQSLRSRPNEPVPPHLMDKLLPLKYFPADTTYIVPASLKLAQERVVLDMPTSTGETRKEERVGVLEFTLKDRPMTLSAFIEAGSNDLNRLFVPFRDLTSGTETYAAGRYLDLDRTPTGLYNVDFNKAYFPYCYYNTTYDCPYPPDENKLPIPIRAGQRLP